MLLHRTRQLCAVGLTVFAIAFAKQDDLALLNQTYDYIIVGGGTSGLTVANRLTENGKKSVPVVEYGYLDNDSRILVPFDSVQFHPEKFYNITSLPIPGLNNRVSRAAAGAIVGGGSATLGNPGWGWSGLLPYFKKSVTFTRPPADVAEQYNYTWNIDGAYGANGGDGPIQVSYPPYAWPQLGLNWEAWKQLGVEKQKEGAGGNAFESFHAPSALDPKTKTRSYAKTAHYDAYKNRKNYHLLTGYQVTEIRFVSNLRAVGVNVVKRGSAEKIAIQAQRETVIAAGALWTPWLLQWSGIGPKSVLEAAGIPVRKDMPGVGANFQDHPVGGAVWNFTNNLFPSPETLTNNATFNEEARRECNQNRTGPFTIARGNQATFLSPRTVNPEWQTIINVLLSQKAEAYLPSSYDKNLTDGFIAQRNMTVALFQTTDNAVFEFAFGGDPLAMPVVDYRTFSNPIDVANTVAMLRYVRRYNSQPALQSLGPVEVSPGLNVTSDADIEKALRNSLFAPSFAHPSSTAAMLPEEFGGVVRPDLRVWQTRRLSVVDASVFPLIPASHLCTTVYAVVEKAADLIKERTDW